MALVQYDSTRYNHVITRLDNNVPYTITGIAKGEHLTVEMEDEPLHSLNVGLHEDAGSFNVNRSLGAKATYTLERTHRDNAYFSTLASNSIQFRLSIIANYDEAGLQEVFTFKYAMVENLFMPTHSSETERTTTWVLTGRIGDSGMYTV